MSDDFDHDPNFRIDPAHPELDADLQAGGHVSPDSSWPDEVLEAAYRQALETNNAVEEKIGPGIDPAEWSSSDEGDEYELAAVSEMLEEPGPPRVTARQLIEAALFVGGRALTAKKLASLVGPDTETSLIEEEIEGLNGLYSSEVRPYQIQLAEGGYRLQLREEFYATRNRVFNLGPKEVQLSQEQLEVLALVASKQPISRLQIEKHGRKNAGGLLRLLLRRQLIVIERGKNPRRDITYRTTSRFLEVFNLPDIQDLPTHERLKTR